MSSFGWTYTKIGTIQRRLAWPLRKDDTQNHEAFHIIKKKKEEIFIIFYLRKVLNSLGRISSKAYASTYN